ncbi:hypothetical protein [Pseudonocardia sp. D17]|uniref:hypothetical protein n=1 Tax=Pseudonocardia sp. D17 TaxID=882661 RepID=UPI0030D1F710
MASADVVNVDADRAGSAVGQHILDHANMDIVHGGVLNDATADVHRGVLNDLGGVLNLDDVLR